MNELVTIYGCVATGPGSRFEFLTFDEGDLAAGGLKGADGAAPVAVSRSPDRVVRIAGGCERSGRKVRCVLDGREVELDPYAVVTFARLRLYGFELVSGEDWRP